MKLFGQEIDMAGSLSLREQIRRIIAAEIRSGRWCVGDRLPSVRELALQSGVSVSPINQALSDLVMEGYLVQHVGRGTFVRATDPAARARTGVAGLVFGGALPGHKATASEMLERELLLAASQRLNESGYSVRVYHEDDVARTGGGIGRIVAASPLLACDGVLNFGPLSDGVLEHVRALELPVVCLGDPHPPEGIPFVAGAIQQAVWEAVDTLHGMGHRSVGLVHTVAGLPVRTRRLRYEAYDGACAELGMRPEAHWSVDTGPRYNVRIRGVHAFLTHPGRPTAVVCTHNHAAQALYEVAALSGVAIPGDLSVLLITGSADFGDDFDPPLSTLVLPTDVYAREAVAMLTGLIGRGDVRSNGGVLVRPMRTLRASVRACPAVPVKAGLS